MKNNSGMIVSLIAMAGVAILIIILVAALGGKVYTTSENKINNIGKIFVTNENFTATLGNSYNFTNTPVINGTYDCDNGTTMLVPGTDYTLGLSNGAFTLLNATYNNTEVICDYEYDNDDGGIKDKVKGSISSSFKGLDQTSNYLPLIVLTLIIVIIVTMFLGLSKGFVGGNNAM